MKALAALLLLCACSAPAYAQCQMDLAPTIEFGAASQDATNYRAYGRIDIRCDIDVRYEVEVINAEPGGRIYLEGPPGSPPLAAYLRAGSRPQPFGQLANGEGVEGLGNGVVQSQSFEVVSELLVLPQEGQYRFNLSLSITY